MKIIENIALISINETMVVQLLSFLLFLYIMNRLMFRPLRGTMAERDQYIQRISDDIYSAERELSVISREMQEKEDLSRKRALKLNEELEETGKRRAEEISASIQEEIGELKEETEQEINIQIREARKSVGKESEILAQTIMEKILGRRLAG